jgi:hypothetical protein
MTKVVDNIQRCRIIDSGSGNGSGRGRGRKKMARAKSCKPEGTEDQRLKAETLHY